MGEDRCSCGWSLPKGLQLLTGGLEHVLIACGACGQWWKLTTSVRGGWKLGYDVEPAMAPGEGESIVDAARETTMTARQGKVCAAQSKPLPGHRVYAYCTRERKHEGDHVAETATGRVVARWSPEDP